MPKRTDQQERIRERIRELAMGLMQGVWRARNRGVLGLLALLPACLAIRSEGPTAPANWEMPTMGGKQFWTDVLHRSGWRLQRHFASGHFRLLDAQQIRHAWGSQAQCEAALAAKTAVGKVPANRETVVILVHGLGRTVGCWKDLTATLEAQTDWQVIPFAYASTRGPIRDHAAALVQVLEGLGSEVKTIHWVGHSLGNIVIRQTLTDLERSGEVGIVSRLGRFVMLGPPNHGSRLARWLYPTLLFPMVTGRSGVELGWDWSSVDQHLAMPPCEFGIIAGGTWDNRQGWNPLLRGASDGLVSLDEALLTGAADCMVRPLFHTTMMKHPDVGEATVRFLKIGCFDPRGLRHSF